MVYRTRMGHRVGWDTEVLHLANKPCLFQGANMAPHAACMHWRADDADAHTGDQAQMQPCSTSRHRWQAEMVLCTQHACCCTHLDQHYIFPHARQARVGCHPLLRCSKSLKEAQALEQGKAGALVWLGREEGDEPVLVHAAASSTQSFHPTTPQPINFLIKRCSRPFSKLRPAQMHVQRCSIDCCL